MDGSFVDPSGKLVTQCAFVIACQGSHRFTAQVCQCSSVPRTYCSEPSPGYRWLAGRPPMIIGETVPSESGCTPAAGTAAGAIGSGSSAVGAAEAAVPGSIAAATAAAASVLRSFLFTVLLSVEG